MTTTTSRRYVGLSLALGVALLIVSSLPTHGTAFAATPSPTIRHVFVIVLENESEGATFGNPSADPYLAQTLVAGGAYVPNYYAIGHASNDNYVAMISGQAPNILNQADCPVYIDFLGIPPLLSGTGTILDGQAIGEGCVYPASVANLGSQLSGGGYTWKAYMGDMGNSPSRESAVCGHPPVNSLDQTQNASAGDGYATRHDPFVYFHNIIDNPSYCAAHVVPLGATNGAMPPSAPSGTTGLVTDLRKTATTPNFSFIVPNLCDDGHDYPCTNEPTPTKSAVGDIDSFLRNWVPAITSSRAFHQDGLLAIVFDESGGDSGADASACCGEIPGPGSPLPGIGGPGGGQVGAVFLSPFIKPGTVSTRSYNHYSLLASIEGMFGLSRLGFAADVPQTFGSDIFNKRPHHR